MSTRRHHRRRNENPKPEEPSAPLPNLEEFNFVALQSLFQTALLNVQSPESQQAMPALRAAVGIKLKPIYALISKYEDQPTDSDLSVPQHYTERGGRGSRGSGTFRRERGGRNEPARGRGRTFGPNVHQSQTSLQDNSALVIALFTVIRYPSSSQKHEIIPKIYKIVYEFIVKDLDPRAKFKTEIEKLLSVSVSDVNKRELLSVLDELEYRYCSIFTNYIDALSTAHNLFHSLQGALQPKPGADHKSAILSLLTRIELHLGDICRYRDRFVLWEFEEAIPLILSARSVLNSKEDDSSDTVWERAVSDKRAFRPRNDALVTSESAGSDANHWAIGYRSIQKRHFISTRYGKVDPNAEKHRRNKPEEKAQAETAQSFQETKWDTFVAEKQGKSNEVSDEEDDIGKHFATPIRDSSSDDNDTDNENVESDTSSTHDAPALENDKLDSLLVKRGKHVFESKYGYYQDAKDHYSISLKRSLDINREQNDKVPLGCDGNALCSLAGLAEIELNSILKDAADVILATDFYCTDLNVPLVQFAINHAVDVAFEAAHAFLKAQWSSRSPSGKAHGEMTTMIRTVVFAQAGSKVASRAICPAFMNCSAAKCYRESFSELSLLIEQYALDGEQVEMRVKIGNNPLLTSWTQMAVLWVIHLTSQNEHKNSRGGACDTPFASYTLLQLLSLISKALEAYELSPTTTRSGEAPFSLQCLWMLMGINTIESKVELRNAHMSLMGSFSESVLQAFRHLGSPADCIMTTRMVRENSDLCSPASRISASSRSVLTAVEGAQMLRQTMLDSTHTTPKNYMSTFDPAHWGNVPGTPDAERTPLPANPSTAASIPKAKSAVDKILEQEMASKSKHTSKRGGRNRKRSKQNERGKESDEDQEEGAPSRQSTLSSNAPISAFPSTPINQIIGERTNWQREFVPPSVETLRTSSGEGASQLIGDLNFLIEYLTFQIAETESLQLFKLSRQCLTTSQKSTGEWTVHPFSNFSVSSQQTPTSASSRSNLSPQPSTSSFTVRRRDDSTLSIGTPAGMGSQSPTVAEDSNISLTIPLAEDYYVRHTTVPSASKSCHVGQNIDYAGNEVEHRAGSKKDQLSNSDPQRDFLIRVARLKSLLAPHQY